MKVKINPVIIESKIGFSRKKDRTTSIAKMITEVTFLKNASSMK